MSRTVSPAASLPVSHNGHQIVGLPPGLGSHPRRFDVVDTNVFVGACLGQGPSAAVVAACLQGKCTPLMAAALLAEYEDVLGRAGLFVKSRLKGAEREELLDVFLAHCRWTRIYFGWRPNLRDEGDNHLVELAVAGGAESIVTHNLRDLAAHELTFGGLGTVTPAQLLKLLETKELP